MLELYHNKTIAQLSHTAYQMSKAISTLKDVFISHETSLLEMVALTSLIGIVVSIFFPIRYVLDNGAATSLGHYSDFTSISLYLSFIFVLVFCGITIYREGAVNKDRTLLIAIALFGLLLVVQQSKLEGAMAWTSLYHFLRISCVLLLGYAVYKSPITLKYKQLLLWICVLLGGIQGIISILQFSMQQSLGISALGESPLAVATYGVAKTVSHGTTFIRSYGSLPHPNILAGVLSVVSFFNIYLLNKTAQIKGRILLSVTFFLIIIGIFASLSRGGIIAVAAGFTVWFALYSYRHKSLLFMRKLWFIPIAIGIGALAFGPWLVPRGTVSDVATNHRVLFNSTGLKIVEENWLIGTGPGTNVFHMKQKLSERLESWEIQPIHNFWLITWSELGIIGLIMSFFVIKTLLLTTWKVFSRENIKRPGQNNPWNVTLAAISVTLLILFMLDHYFYTVWPATVLLALILGFTWKELVPHNEVVFSRDEVVSPRGEIIVSHDT